MKTTLRRWLLFTVVFVVLVSSSGLAASRWVVDLRSGAGAGLIGLGIEVEWSGFGLCATAGTTGGTVAGGLGLRFYFSQEAKSRGFAGPIVGFAGTDVLALPYVGGTAGFEWRISPSIRATIEAGLGFVLIIPLPIIGLSIGWVF